MLKEMEIYNIRKAYEKERMERTNKFIQDINDLIMHSDLTAVEVIAAFEHLKGAQLESLK